MLDKLGIVGSAICALHCALPVLFSFMSPSITVYFGNEWIHYALLITVTPLAMFSFFAAKKIHEKMIPLFVGSIGISSLVFAILAESHFNNTNYNFELLLTIFGSLVLISGHFLNLQLLSKHNLAKGLFS